MAKDNRVSHFALEQMVYWVALTVGAAGRRSLSRKMLRWKSGGRVKSKVRARDR